jgi:hypothetical protein
MGMLWTAIKWQIPILGKMFGSNRLMVKFTKDQRVNLIAYKMPKDHAIKFPSQEAGMNKTVIRQNWHFLPNGIPVDVVVEGRGENMNLIRAEGESHQDQDTAALCNSSFQLGEMVERRKHKASKLQMLMMLLCLIGLAAGIMALINSYNFTEVVLPKNNQAVYDTVSAAVSDGVRTGVLDLNLPMSAGGSGGGITLPTKK